MKRNKDLFTMLRDELFNDSLTSRMIGKKLQEEIFNVEKGNYKTTIKCSFDTDGYPVGMNYTTEYVPNEWEEKMNKLHMNLDDALEKEDYLAAADFKKQIQELEKTNKTNKTNKQLEEAK